MHVACKIAAFANGNRLLFHPAGHAEKSAALERQFPLLENIHVERDYPNTVVVRADAATAAYAMQTSGGWLSLSAGLKILDKTAAQPELPVLYGGEPESATPGVQLEFAADTPAASDSAASSEAAAPADKRLYSLNTLLTALDSSGLGADVTRIEFEDPEQMAFLYQGRISVLLGTLNELDYKLRLAKYVLLDEDGKLLAHRHRDAGPEPPERLVHPQIPLRTGRADSALGLYRPGAGRGPGTDRASAGGSLRPRT